jgi:hypothetical protein
VKEDVSVRRFQVLAWAGGVLCLALFLLALPPNRVPWLVAAGGALVLALATMRWSSNAGGQSITEVLQRLEAMLDRAESQALAAVESTRNYPACREHRGYCDPSRLSPAEAASIPPEVR